MKIIRLRVKPGSRDSGLDPLPDGAWVARVKAPPVDGRANREVIALVAEHFGCPRSAVRLRSGATGRWKLVQFPETPPARHRGCQTHRHPENIAP